MFEKVGLSSEIKKKWTSAQLMVEFSDPEILMNMICVKSGPDCMNDLKSYEFFHKKMANGLVVVHLGISVLNVYYNK